MVRDQTIYTQAMPFFLTAAATLFHAVLAQQCLVILCKQVTKNYVPFKFPADASQPTPVHANVNVLRAGLMRHNLLQEIEPSIQRY